ncbi:MAG: RNA methyltransferase [Candidatus Krumholzibacteriota bacterium]|nr:RNA methyltransferase [Candidatus Krumholzibacteriota bacterium]
MAVPAIMQGRYDKNEHDFDPRDFEPGRVHRIADDAVMFSEDMTPAVALWNPKYPHNVGAAVRAASCFGGRLVLFSGDRIQIEGKKGWRLPREERMKGYRDVTIINDDHFFDRFPGTVTPVAVEVRRSTETLPVFAHPEKALYVFGPEDGSLPPSALRHCHRFVAIPSVHCLNLGSAVNVVLYDRLVKLGVTDRKEITYPGNRP